MNANHLINMIVRMVTRQLLHRGVNAGIDAVAGRGKSREEMSRDERQQARSAKKSVGRANQAMRAARRIGRL